ncbi:permease [Salinibacter sp. 10B]|uniref:FtsX-like permease family protein n=1 Tax=Salinibacter sp. 10B TaxID=1923971 RepID=UPI000CF4A33E|nr:FtsX-like permease family protein [Salinibacter sp. 10B]PQJ35925.1 permease [Salinibacter sp. 10B]
MSLLQRSSRRYLTRHPWLMGLSVLGVAIGVAVVVSIDLANTSAERAFQLSAETVTGKATHQVVGAGETLDDDVYRQLRTEAGVRPSAPIVEGYASLERGDRTFQVVGIDPFTDAPFRPYLGTGAGGDLDLGTFMTQDAALMSAPTAETLGLNPGDTLAVQIEGTMRPVLLAGVVEPEDERTRRAVANLLVVDVSTAQGLFDMRGTLSRIDLILPSDDAEQTTALDRIRATLPDGARVQRSETRTQTVEQMTRAFELNLTALSLLALVVGAFLIYNTMTFSIVQRRSLIGRLRALGVTQRQIFGLVLGEAAILGVVGTGIGLLLGIVLASGLVQLLAQTINDLYFVVQVSELSITPWILVKGSLLGIGTTILAALPPAREATNAPVSTVLRRSTQETNVQALAPWLAGGGVLVGTLGVVMLTVTEQSIVVSYAALLCLLIAAALVTPLAVMGLAKAFRPLLDRLFGVLGRMAARGVVTSLSRTGVAIAALMVAVAATIGVGLMIDSFRGTVEDWLTQSLQADVYVQPPSLVFRRSNATIDSTVTARLRSMENVAGAYSVRRVSVQANVGPTELVAIEPGPETPDVYRFKVGEPDKIWPQFRTSATVFISEPYAYRHDLAVGDTVRLQTDRGRASFPIEGIYYDYGSDRGVVMMSRGTYERFYDDDGVSGLAFYAAEGTSVDDLIADMRAEVQGLQDVIIRSNKALRETSLQVFDRTFTITTVLRILAIVVAFIGVLSALMALELERRREMGVLRATGMTPPQLGGFVTIETGLMGTIAGLLSLPLGYALAYVLVFVINKRSFGWTMQLSVSPDILLQALLLAVGAALLAGLYPAWSMAQASPATALRDE